MAAARQPLNTDRILDAGLAYADEHGLASLSMRKLAHSLGFEVMSLYNHVANKDDMIDGMVERAAAELDPAPADGEWRVAVRHSALSARRMFTRHPWVAPLWLDRVPGPVRLDYVEGLLRALRQGGFTPAGACKAFHAVLMHMVGFTLQEQAFPIEAEDFDEAATTFLARLPVDRYPYMAEHIAQHLEPSEEGDGEFEFVLDLILDGLERARTRP